MEVGVPAGNVGLAALQIVVDADTCMYVCMDVCCMHVSVQVCMYVCQCLFPYVPCLCARLHIKASGTATIRLCSSISNTKKSTTNREVEHQTCCCIAEDSLNKVVACAISCHVHGTPVALQQSDF